MAPISLPCLFIPDDSSLNQPIKKMTLKYHPPSKDFNGVVCELLQSQFCDVETIYSEEDMELFKGAPDGLAPGRRFIVYEVYMDDDAIAARPPNSLATDILARPRCHGPILMFKTTCKKSSDGATEIVRYHGVSEQELDGRHFQHKRMQYLVQKARHGQGMNNALTGIITDTNVSRGRPLRILGGWRTNSLESLGLVIVDLHQ